MLKLHLLDDVVNNAIVSRRHDAAYYDVVASTMRIMAKKDTKYSVS